MTTHGREYFYKYVTADTAVAILENCSVRWSSPRLFNDPFDVQFDLHLPYSDDEMAEAFKQRLIDWFENGVPETVSQPYDQLSSFAGLVNNLKKHGINPNTDFFSEHFGSDFGQILANTSQDLTETNEIARKYRLNQRIFCVSETNDHLLMWAHYASSHTGAVIKFKCLSEGNTELCSAQRVRYESDMPKWGTTDSWLDVYTGVSDGRSITEIFLDTTALTKGHVWSYEKEWRITGEFDDDDQRRLGYADVRILPQEIDEITLGCRMSEGDRVKLVELVKTKYPHAKIMVAQTHPTQFGLVITPLGEELT